MSAPWFSVYSVPPSVTSVVHSSGRMGQMTVASWITLIVVAGIVWGGFAFLLSLALRREAAKQDR